MYATALVRPLPQHNLPCTQYLHIYMYARVRARQRKHEICLHSALYDYNTLILNYLSVYTPSAPRALGKNCLGKVQTPISSSKHPEGNEEKR